MNVDHKRHTCWFLAASPMRCSLSGKETYDGVVWLLWSSIVLPDTDAAVKTHINAALQMQVALNLQVNGGVFGHRCCCASYLGDVEGWGQDIPWVWSNLWPPCLIMCIPPIPSFQLPTTSPDLPKYSYLTLYDAYQYVGGNAIGNEARAARLPRMEGNLWAYLAFHFWRRT